MRGYIPVVLNTKQYAYDFISELCTVAMRSIPKSGEYQSRPVTSQRELNNIGD